MRDWHTTIRNLLTKAEDPATTSHERESLQQKAAYLMAKFGIEELTAAKATGIPLVATKTVFTLLNPYKTHKSALMNGIATALDCRAVLVKRTKPETVQIFGLAEDVARFEMLYTSLLLQGLIGLDKADVPTDSAGNKLIHGKTYKNSWLLGFVSNVVMRVKQGANQAKQEATTTPGTALVLADRTSVVNAAIFAEFGQLGKRQTTNNNINSTGYAAGAAAGRSADIGHTRLGDPRRRIAS